MFIVKILFCLNHLIIDKEQFTITFLIQIQSYRDRQLVSSVSHPKPEMLQSLTMH